MPLEGAHILRKSLDGALLTLTGTNEFQVTSGDGWDIHTATGSVDFAVNRGSYFDLSGYTREELTTFPMNWDISEDGKVINLQNAADYFCGIKTWDIISEKPITDEDLDVLAVSGAPGFLPSHHEARGIVGARWREYAWNTTMASSIAPTPLTIIDCYVAVSDEWGLCQATTVQHLYITRIMRMFDATSAAGTISIPNSIWSIGVVTAEEKDLVYVERLRRSWEQR